MDAKFGTTPSVVCEMFHPDLSYMKHSWITLMSVSIPVFICVDYVSDMNIHVNIPGQRMEAFAYYLVSLADRLKHNICVIVMHG